MCVVLSLCGSQFTLVAHEQIFFLINSFIFFDLHVNIIYEREVVKTCFLYKNFFLIIGAKFQ